MGGVKKGGALGKGLPFFSSAVPSQKGGGGGKGERENNEAFQEPLGGKATSLRTGNEVLSPLVFLCVPLKEARESAAVFTSSAVAPSLNMAGHPVTQEFQFLLKPAFLPT